MSRFLWFTVYIHIRPYMLFWFPSSFFSFGTCSGCFRGSMWSD